MTDLPPGSSILRITPHMRTPAAIASMRRDIADLERQLGVTSDWRESPRQAPAKHKPSEVLRGDE
jgi:hypothetical protein